MPITPNVEVMRDLTTGINAANRTYWADVEARRNHR